MTVPWLKGAGEGEPFPIHAEIVLAALICHQRNWARWNTYGECSWMRGNLEHSIEWHLTFSCSAWIANGFAGNTKSILVVKHFWSCVFGLWRVFVVVEERFLFRRWNSSIIIKIQKTQWNFWWIDDFRIDSSEASLSFRLGWWKELN